MFWKNWDKDNKPAPLINIPPMTPETRTAFRVSPSPENPLVAKIEGKNVLALDISAGGMAFENNHFLEGAVYSAEFTLPGIQETFSVKLEILEIRENKQCRAKFQGLSKRQEDMIHYYALNRQKEDLQKDKYF